MRQKLGIITEIADEALLNEHALGSDWLVRHVVERHVARYSEQLKSWATCLWDYNRFKGDGPVMDASYLRWWLWSLVKDSREWRLQRLWHWLRRKIEPQVPSATCIQDSILAQRYWLEKNGLKARAVIVHPDIRYQLWATPETYQYVSMVDPQWWSKTENMEVKMADSAPAFCGLRVIVNPDMRRWGAYVV